MNSDNFKNPFFGKPREDKTPVFGAINSEDQAKKTVKICGIILLCVAVYDVVAGVIGEFQDLFIDAAIFAILGGLIIRFKSRAAAITLLVFICLATLGLVLDVLNSSDPGLYWGFAFLAVLFGVSIWCLQAVYKISNS